MGNLPLDRTATLVPAFAVKDLPLAEHCNNDDGDDDDDLESIIYDNTTKSYFRACVYKVYSSKVSDSSNKNLDAGYFYFYQ